MSAWSPTLEGFRTIFRRPAVPLAEVLWRWSFGAAACILLGLGFVEYLDTLPVSNVDLFFFRSGHPLLISQAVSRILQGSGLRFVLAGVVLFAALAILWILLASFGRVATVKTVVEYIRNRAGEVRAADTTEVTPAPDAAAGGSLPALRLGSMAGLHFLRAGLGLAACAGCFAALILAGLTSSKADPRPGLVFLIAVALLLVVWLVWSFVSWFLSLASIFVVRQGEDTFGALASAVDFCRERGGPVAAVGTWFGLTHLVLFVVATSVVAFPLSFTRVVPVGFVLGAVLLLTLLYFAVVDTLYVARLAGYVAILEAPPTPVVVTAPLPPSVPGGGEPAALSLQQLALDNQSDPAMVDQDETILSDIAPPDDPGPFVN